METFSELDLNLWNFRERDQRAIAWVGHARVGLCGCLEHQVRVLKDMQRL